MPNICKYLHAPQTHVLLPTCGFLAQGIHVDPGGGAASSSRPLASVDEVVVTEVDTVVSVPELRVTHGPVCVIHRSSILPSVRSQSNRLHEIEKH